MKRSRNDINIDDDRARIVEQAAFWYLKMNDGVPLEADRAALQSWLTSDERHAVAYAEVGRLWDGAMGMSLSKPQRVRPLVSRRTIGKAAVGAGLGLAGWMSLNDYPTADFHTGIGERRSIALPDGSTVDLAAKSALSLDYSTQRRRLQLHEGDAFFNVAPDAQRPFIVAAGRGQITALGTAFGVALHEDRATVIVTEHGVEVLHDKRATRLTAGTAIDYQVDMMGDPHPSETRADLAWREGRLVFTRAPLGLVVKTLNRWRKGRVILMSSALAARPVTLIANLHRLDGVMSQLAQAIPLRVVDGPFKTVLLFAPN